MALTATLPSVAAAEYAEKPVEFLVPWPPGDLEDVLTRMIAVAQKTIMSERAQQPIQDTGALVHWQSAAETTARMLGRYENAGPDQRRAGTVADPTGP